ncbi:MAG: hypothetical protein ACTSR8_12325 [Promethearchaeota archaeon]
MAENIDPTQCQHKNKTHEGGYVVCKDCGLILDELDFQDLESASYVSDTQSEYEKKLVINDSKAKQDPLIKEKYDKIQMLDKWFRDYKTSFTEQKKTIEQLKTLGIGLGIDNAKFQNIKKRYLKYNRKDRKTYQNMVIIFLALVWDEIKETSNIRLEKFIEVCRDDLGHKINKKMLNNAVYRIKAAEQKRKLKKSQKTITEIESEIKQKIKILFQKNLNNIPYTKVEDQVSSSEDFEKLKIKMTLKADEILHNITYDQIKNLNYKAFTAGLIYYIGQTLYNRKIFTQQLVNETTDFSSTTIRKKFHILKDILGDPRSNSIEIN